MYVSDVMFLEINLKYKNKLILYGINFIDKWSDFFTSEYSKEYNLNYKCLCSMLFVNYDDL